MMDISDPQPLILDRYAVELLRPDELEPTVVVVPAEDSGRAIAMARFRTSCETGCAEDALRVLSVKWTPSGGTA